ncbi:MAG: LysM peptidoglycan-binding domain-containing protein [Deltaproteobacteria bacterium]|nr:LysM peptidoglycan-binding domain-containing protein [Deltaproteobacteria bacterium]
MTYLYNLSKITIFSFILLFICGCLQQPESSYHSYYNKIYGEEFSEEEQTFQNAPEDIAGKYEDVDSSIKLIFNDAFELCETAEQLWEQEKVEQALKTLDKAYVIIDKINLEDNPKASRQKEELSFWISKRIMDIYSSKMPAEQQSYAQEKRSVITINMNKHVQKQIHLLTKGAYKDFFIRAYKRAGKYRPQMVKMLREAGLPTELSWLPLIESGFNAKALSPAKALGLWQFIPSTGNNFGLKRNTYIDERLDFIKSTQAAISYLTKLYEIFGDWPMALAAYNCGEGRLIRIIEKQHISYNNTFWGIYTKLPPETAKYIPRFLATLHIIRNSERYGLDRVIQDPPLFYEVAVVNKQTSLKNIAKLISVPENVLKNLNPALRYGVLPPTKYSLRTPLGKKNLLIANIGSLPVSGIPTKWKKKNKRKIIYHKVKKGETISTIARRYKTTVKSIKGANNIKKNNMIFANMKLKVPSSKAVFYKKSSKGGGTLFSYKVKQGDSLWNLARRYKTTAKKIQAINNLSTTLLYIGQILKIMPNKSS